MPARANRFDSCTLRTSSTAGTNNNYQFSKTCNNSPMTVSSSHLITFLSIAILAIIAVIYFWQFTLLLIPLLLLLAYFKHRFSPIHHEALMFVLFGIFGTTVESLMMSSGAWHYTSPTIFNFPLWLPFLWGLACTLCITLYLSFSKH